VVLMNKGAVEQVGTPEEVYDNPATPFVFGFLGSVNLFHGRVVAGGDGDVLHIGEHSLPMEANALELGASAVAYARPHDIEIERIVPGATGMPATVRRILIIGPTARLELQAHGDSRVLEVELPRERVQALALKEGEFVVVKAKNVRVFAHK
jgi:sulfate/thiosulfate transport system ATP-binding protein